ncbi:MAG: hypothetical protein V1746_06135 [bacterium]
MNEPLFKRELKREEWDFSKIPKRELRACLIWECAREWKDLKDQLHSIPSEMMTVVEKDNTEGGKYPGDIEYGEMPNPKHEEFLENPDEWIGCINSLFLESYSFSLDKPWQLLGATDRQRMIRNHFPEHSGINEIKKN